MGPRRPAVRAWERDRNCPAATAFHRWPFSSPWMSVVNAASRSGWGQPSSMGRLPRSRRDVVVVGSGISGMSVAYELCRAGFHAPGTDPGILDKATKKVGMPIAPETGIPFQVHEDTPSLRYLAAPARSVRKAVGPFYAETIVVEEDKNGSDQDVSGEAKREARMPQRHPRGRAITECCRPNKATRPRSIRAAAHGSRLPPASLMPCGKEAARFAKKDDKARPDCPHHNKSGPGIDQAQASARLDHGGKADPARSAIGCCQEFRGAPPRPT